MRRIEGEIVNGEFRMLKSEKNFGKNDIQKQYFSNYSYLECHQMNYKVFRTDV